ncbi:MAG: hypothetical protein QM831_27705 [Kofleriaceae bacterium]
MKHLLLAIVLVVGCRQGGGSNLSDDDDTIEATCGDGTCQDSESIDSCPGDCFTCGDGECTSPTETAETCPQDCVICGDGVCSPGETAKTCDDDCTMCGDGLCTGNETVDNCPADCDKCGDGACTGAETVTSCAADCSVCGDGMCTGAETTTACPSDCAATLKIVNSSTQSWYYFYGWPCGGSNPYQNLLSSPLAPNTYATMTGVTPGCYNFQAWNYNSSTYWSWTNMQFTAGHETTITGY